MVKGWAEHPGGRHHGAHGALIPASLKAPDAELFDFSQNVNPLGAPPGALEAARRALYEESGRYPDLGYGELRGALAEYLGVPPERILPTNGGAEALFLAARAARVAGAPGDGGGGALVLEPTFSEYAAAAHAAGLGLVRRVARRRADGFRLDRASLDDLEGVSVVFLCNPNNPTGEALPRAEVLEVARRAREGGAVLVVDEAFADFVPGVSVAGDVDAGLYVARSLTKFFAVPGLRLGCLVCPQPARAQEFQPSWSVNAVAAAAGVAAAGDGEFAERSLSEVARLRRKLFDGLGEIAGIEPFPGNANFLLVRGPEGIAERLAGRGILVRGCAPFLGLGPEYFRVAVRGDRENEGLLRGIREAL